MAVHMRVPMRRTSVWDDRSGSSFSKLLQGTAANLSECKESESDNDEEEEEKDIVTINVGGTIFHIYNDTLKNVFNTKLSNLTKSSRHYNTNRDEYFFDRSPVMFNFILDCYRHTGQEGNHIPKDVCPFEIRRELAYWGLTTDNICKCCRKHYFDGMDEINTQDILLQEFQGLPNKIYDVLSKNNCADDMSWRDMVWIFLDNPKSSRGAKVWAFVYLVMTVLTVFSFFLQTHPVFRIPLHESHGINYSHYQQNSSNSNKINFLRTTLPHQFLHVFDLCCMTYFTIELMVRFVVCKRRLRLFKSSTCIFDTLYLLPIWTVNIIDFANRDYWHKEENMSLYLILETCKVFRVLRLVRFFRHYRGLKILYLAVRASVRELFLLAVFVAFAITLYATLIYYTELYHDNNIDNAFMGLWFALITMTTVGYGDTFPDTGFGYVVASCCALTGIILIGMPVPIITSYFHSYYGLRLPEDMDHRVVPKVKKTTKVRAPSIS